MSSSLRRFTAPSLAVLALAAVPLVAPVAANAALGGAFPVTTTLKPDLRTAAVVTTPNSGASSIVQICFDKKLDPAVTPSKFTLGAYDHTPLSTATVTTTANCVLATFGKASLVPYTYVTVAGGGVQSAGVVNLDDSTALINATPSNNGTTGKTTGPDLTGIQRGSNSQARFTFDENVDPATAVANFAQFHLDNASGTASDATSAAVDVNAPNVVVANFGTVVNAAVRGYADAGAVNSDAAGVSNPLLAVALPAPGGTLSTANPDLVSAAVSADGTTVEYKFDEDISGGVLDATKFTVRRSDGSSAGLLAVAPVLSDNVTVRATIPSGSSQNEYFVVASATAGAVTKGGRPSTDGGVPVGANQGAAATGFTTGPEVLSATFNPTGGTVALKLDQRFFNAPVAGSIKLLNAAGTVVGASTVVTGTASSTAAQVTATAVFTPAEVAAAKSVQVDADAFTTFLGAGVGGNVVQIVSPTAP